MDLIYPMEHIRVFISVLHENPSSTLNIWLQEAAVIEVRAESYDHAEQNL